MSLNCKDIFGNDITQFVFNDDGTVYGVVNITPPEPPQTPPIDTNDNSNVTTYNGAIQSSREVFNTDIPPKLVPAQKEGDGFTTNPINQECCNALNFTWDSGENKCYWTEPCDLEPDVKITMGAQGNNGALFHVDDNEVCQLEVNFKYLLQFDCETLSECYNVSDASTTCLGIFENLDIWVQLDKVVQREVEDSVSYETINTLETVYEAPLYQVDDIVEFFDGNCQTGLYVTGGTRCLQQLESCLVQSLSANCDVLSACTLDSDWVDYSFTITDFDTLTGITNEEIKLSFLIKNSDCDFSILIDRIEFNKNCTETEGNDVYITLAPNFELERVIDNKKSWVANDFDTERDYGVEGRETEYDINHHKLAINTKELDLEFNAADAIELDVWCYGNDNPKLYECSTGYTELDLFIGHDFDSILETAASACTEYNCTGPISGITSEWSLDVSLKGCETNILYSGTPFFNSTGAPTNEEYENEIIKISNQIGLLYEKNGDYMNIKSPIINCNDNYNNKDLCVDLRLNITNCENLDYKQFEDGEFFEFQNDEPYEFD